MVRIGFVSCFGCFVKATKTICAHKSRKLFTFRLQTIFSLITVWHRNFAELVQDESWWLSAWDLQKSDGCCVMISWVKWIEENSFYFIHGDLYPWRSIAHRISQLHLELGASWHTFSERTRSCPEIRPASHPPLLLGPYSTPSIACQQVRQFNHFKQCHKWYAYPEI